MGKEYPYLQSSYHNTGKDNPYLENPYAYDGNAEKERQHFLAQLDTFANQRQYINIVLLDGQENPIKEISGVIESGSISKDGSSSVRRTASLTCSVNQEEYNVDDLNMDFSINKKIFLEIGVKNDTQQHPEGPILGFPQGVFFIDSISINSSIGTSVSLNVSLKDKMCLLNGDVGGTLPASVQFDVTDSQTSTGEFVTQKELYFNIITELVNHYGEEDLNRIIIKDVPLRVRRVMQWTGDSPIYLSEEAKDGKVEYQIYEEEPTEINFSIYSNGDDIGYVYTDFVPTSEITCGAGDSVCTVLDTIVQQLGNYEYFYDEFGNFHFQEIRNYKNITQANTIQQETGNPGRTMNLEEGQFQLDTGSELQYLIETSNDKSVFLFDSARNLTSISVTPSYSNIKNDFIINGGRKSTVSDSQVMVRYRLAIDEKPTPIGYTTKDRNAIANNSKEEGAVPYYGVFDNLILYTEASYGDGITETTEATESSVTDPTIVGKDTRLAKWVDHFIPVYNEDGKQIYDENGEPIRKLTLPAVGNENVIYRLQDEEGNQDNHFYHGNGKSYSQVQLKEGDNVTEPIIYSSVYISTRSEEDAEQEARLEPYYVTDGRTFLYCYGLEARSLGLDPGPYFEDLDAFGPTEFNLKRSVQKFFGEDNQQNVYYKTLTQGNFFFDIIDATTSSLGQYSVQNIGRRIDAVTNDDINCLFEPEIPNVVFLNSDNPEYNGSDNTSVAGNRTIEEKTAMLEAQKGECNRNSQPGVQVPNTIYSAMSTGGYKNSAYVALRYELYLHTVYQKVVSITAMPNFGLEPNSRVELSENTTQSFGDYIVQNISLTLGPGANMTVSLNEVTERL